MAKSTNNIFISLAAILLLVFGGLAIAKVLADQKPKPVHTKQREHILSVRAVKSVYEDLQLPIQYHGRVRSSEIVNLAAEVSGLIKQGEVPLKEGQPFRRGQLLVNIYSKDFEATLKASKSNFLTDLAKILPDVEVDYTAELGKWQSFFKAVDLNKNLPELPAIHSDQEKVFLASRKILSSYYNIKQQEIKLSRYRIYAPFDGVYQSVSQEAGAQARSGQTLARIIRTDQLDIVTEVLPEDAKWIQSNDLVEISSYGETFPAKVIRKALFVDAETQTVKIYVRTKAPVMDGQFVELTFRNKPYEQVFKLNREALFEQNRVYLVKDGQLKKHQVEIVKKLDDYYLVRGLTPDEWVVNESLVNAKDGLKVNLLK
ncbi:MAG: efflux RND transporter periplasmic adaptor subunit [Cytophagales bacterium]|nr:efflux RND transporter periplasmic adaptor subunit [Cytophagales bacterium]